MNKATALAIFSFALIACKKDTKTITKTDPETGKTITVEVPADSLTTETATINKPAISDSAGVFTQTFKLAKGSTYPLRTVQKDTQTLTAPNGESQSAKSESIDEMSFLVNDFQNGVYDITINLLGKKSSQTANGKTVVVDTKAAEPKEEQLKMMWKVNKALVGNKLNMKMDVNGNVTSITGFDPVYTKVNSALSGAIKDAKERNAFVNDFKKSFNQESLKEQFEKNLIIIPKKGAKAGGTWSESENATPDGKIKLSTNYTLKNVDNGTAVVVMSGGIPKKSDKQSQEGITRTITSELSQNGTITLDQNTGWIKNQNITIKTSQSETLSDGKQSQTMKTSSNSTIAVNP